MSERRKAFSRIIPNYLGLLSTLLLGLLLVRLLLQSLGTTGYGLTALLGSSVGIGAMMYEIVRNSLIRELGAADHSADTDRFIRVFNSALFLAMILGVMALAVFGSLILILPLLEIEPSLLSAARWFVLIRGLQTAIVIVLAPITNMYLVCERMVAHNLILVSDRIALIGGAAFVLLAMSEATPAQRVVGYAMVATALEVLFFGTAAIWIVGQDRRLRPRPSRICREAIQDIIRIGKWNVGVVTAIGLHLRINAFIMNLFFGAMGNAIFGIALMVASYTRRFAVGMTLGLDAVAVRLSTQEGDDAIRRLIHQATRTHALAALPAGAFILLFARPLVEVWVGDTIEDPDSTLPAVIWIIRVLTIGIVVRAISDGWIRVLYGAGYINRVGPVVVAGAVLNPVLAIGATAMLPPPFHVTGPAWSFSVVLVFLHGLLLPWKTARLLQLRPSQIFEPLLRPAIATVVAAAPFVFLYRIIPSGSPWWWFGAAMCFCVFFAMVAWIVVLSGSERSSVKQLVRQRGRINHPIDAADATDDSCE